MMIMSNSGCLNRIPDTDYGARADCLLAISRGDAYFYNSGFFMLTDVSIGVIIAAYVIVAGFAIWTMSDHPKLRHSQKWGYALGFVGALPIFLPLYLIFSPARAAESEDDFFSRVRADHPAVTPQDRSAP